MFVKERKKERKKNKQMFVKERKKERTNKC